MYINQLHTFDKIEWQIAQQQIYNQVSLLTKNVQHAISQPATESLI